MQKVIFIYLVVIKICYIKYILVLVLFKKSIVCKFVKKISRIFSDLDTTVLMDLMLTSPGQLLFRCK